MFLGLLALLKSKSSRPDLIKDGENHVLLIDALKKEFKVCINVNNK